MELGVKGLDGISVASPCNVSWDSMTGNGCVRFCGQCKKNVYDISSMTRVEAENLVRKTEGKLCVTFYRRDDGTVLTDDCPVGVRAVRLLRKKLSLAASSIAAFLGLGTLAGCPDRRPAGPDPQPQPQRTMGEACYVPPPTATPTSATVATTNTSAETAK